MTEVSESPPRVVFEKSSEGTFLEGLVRGKHEVLVDERDRGPPVGSGKDLHPTPVDMLLVALVSCQVAVLTQCLAKSRIDEFEIAASGDVIESGTGEIPDEMPENTATRIGRIAVEVELTVPEAYEGRASRCLEVYDQGCIVGQSLLAGVEYDPVTTLTVAD